MKPTPSLSLFTLPLPFTTANPLPSPGSPFPLAPHAHPSPQDGTDPFYGDITYYYAYGTGSCGWALGGLRHVVALSVAQQGIPATLCGRGITIDARGYQVNVTVMDSCEGCSWGDVDVDEATFVEIFGSTTLGIKGGLGCVGNWGRRGFTSLYIYMDAIFRRLEVLGVWSLMGF